MYISNDISKISIRQALFSEFTESTLHVFDRLIDLMRSKPSFMISQSKIAAHLNICVKTVQRAISFLENLGLIVKKFYDYFSVNIYIVNREVYKHAYEFRFKFPSLRKFLNFVILMANKQNVLPYIKDNDIYNNPSKRSDASDQQLGSLVSKLTGIFTKKEENKIVDVGKLKMNRVLDEISQKLRLTNHGILKLGVFPEVVLAENWIKVKRMYGIQDPFALLFTACLNYCRQANLPISWKKYYGALKEHNLTIDAPVVFPVKKEQAVSHKTVDYVNTTVRKRRFEGLGAHPDFALETLNFIQNSQE